MADWKALLGHRVIVKEWDEDDLLERFILEISPGGRIRFNYGPAFGGHPHWHSPGDWKESDFYDLVEDLGVVPNQKRSSITNGEVEI